MVFHSSFAILDFPSYTSEFIEILLRMVLLFHKIHTKIDEVIITSNKVEDSFESIHSMKLGFNLLIKRH